MAKSPRYKVLKKNVRALRKELLPRAFSPTGSYTETKLTRAAAFRVLAHAEIETYLEDRVKDVIRLAISRWRSGAVSNPIQSRVLLALLAFSGFEAATPPATLVAPQPSQVPLWPDRIELNKRINKAASLMFRGIALNHGVKEENLLSLLIPIGYAPSKIDPNWLAAMNSFGARRGEAAHTARLRQALDPANELKTVNDLLVFLDSVDLEINQLC